MTPDERLPAGQGQHPQSPLLERERELRAMTAALDRISTSSGSFLALAGPAGVGKSRLLAVGGELAADRGLRVLTATGNELEADFSFGLILQLLEPVLAAAGEPDRRQLLRGAAGHAASLFETDSVTEAAGTGGDTVFPILHGLHWLIANLAEEQPLLLNVDDAQWGDLPSLRFLNYLGVRLRELPVGVFVAYRPPRPAPPPGSRGRLLAELASGTEDVAIEIAPLSAQAAADYVEARLPGAAAEFCEACAEITGGIPFVLEQLLVQLGEEGLAPSAEAAPAVRRLVPGAIARRILLRLGALSVEAQRLALAFSVLGEGSRLDHAAELAGLTPESARVQLGALLEADILRDRPDLRFYHPIVRSVIYEDIPPSDRIDLHDRAARILEADGSAAELVAAHIMETPPAGRSQRCRVLQGAAQAALAAGAAAQAAAYLQRAVDEPAQPSDRAQLLQQLGSARAMAGLPDATENLEQALALISEPRDRAAALLTLGRRHYAQGRPGNAADAFERGLAELDDRDRELRLWLEAELFQPATLDPGRHETILARGRELLAQAADDPPTAAERALAAAVALHLTLFGREREAAIGYARRALGAGAVAGDEAADLNTLLACTGVFYAAGELERNIELASAAAADAQRRGSLPAFASAIYVRACAQLPRGRILDAAADAERAADARRSGWEQFLPVAVAIELEALAHRDEIERAERIAAELPEEHWVETVMWGNFAGGRGELRMAQGRMREALEDLLVWGERVPFPNPAILGHWRGRASRCLLALGEGERAIDLAAEELAAAESWGAADSIGRAQVGLGLARGGSEGIALLEAGVATLGDAQSELWLCEGLCDLGRALRHQNHGRAAREPLRRSLELAQRLGSLRIAAQAREELLASGARPRRVALSGAASLTPAELGTARLAAAGMTNREVAEARFVTIKAVEWHLRNAYRKLGISRRKELAAALDQDDLP